jgi:hypothetical protein
VYVCMFVYIHVLIHGSMPIGNQLIVSMIRHSYARLCMYAYELLCVYTCRHTMHNYIMFVYMNACVSIYVYIHTWGEEYTEFKYRHIHIYIPTCMHAHTIKHAHAIILIHSHIFESHYTCMYVCIYIHIHTHRQTCTHTHTHT